MAILFNLVSFCVAVFGVSRRVLALFVVPNASSHTILILKNPSAPMRAHLTLSTNTTNPTPTYTLLLNNIFYTILWLSNLFHIPIIRHKLENLKNLGTNMGFFLFWNKKNHEILNDNDDSGIITISFSPLYVPF